MPADRPIIPKSTGASNEASGWNLQAAPFSRRDDLRPEIYYSVRFEADEQELSRSLNLLEDLPDMVTYSNDSNTYALTVSELLSWDYRTYRFGTSTATTTASPRRRCRIGWPTEIEDWFYTLIAC